MSAGTKKIAFVINPNAGVKRKIDIIEFVKNYFPESINYDLIVWKNPYDFASVKQQILSGGYTVVVACGGDGTVNMVSSVVMNTDMALAILPLGSGNGLARSNQIPLDLEDALAVIAKAETKTIDGALINGIPFFCTAGVGFDALIADKFAASTTRGFATYFKTSISEFFSYRPNDYKITVDGAPLQTKAFLITVANAGQWGNDVYISPEALLNDGILHVSILKPFSLSALGGIGWKLFRKKIHTSSHLISLKGKIIEIEFEGKLPVHYDGEPLQAENRLKIEVQPAALKIVC